MCCGKNCEKNHCKSKQHQHLSIYSRAFVIILQGVLKGQEMPVFQP